MTNVLVIDDEAPIRLLCRVNLEAEGMAVLEAGDGPSGLELAGAERPDVILLDVMMPGLDGWAVASALLENPDTTEIPIIFLTARAEFRDRARGLDIGGIDYITKPFNPVELAPLVRAVLERLERGERDELRHEKLRELASLMTGELATCSSVRAADAFRRPRASIPVCSSAAAARGADAFRVLRDLDPLLRIRICAASAGAAAKRTPSGILRDPDPLPLRIRICAENQLPAKSAVATVAPS